jgi:putative FmdB family regulatory protein
MPLYEYQCETCEHRFEKIQKFTDPPPDCCPKCGGPVRKLFSSPAIQFKGTGFYITDYAKKSSSDGGQSDSSEKSGSSEKQQEKKDKSESGSGKSDSGSTKADSGSSGKSDSASSSSGDSAPASTTKPKT